MRADSPSAPKSTRRSACLFRIAHFSNWDTCLHPPSVGDLLIVGINQLKTAFEKVAASQGPFPRPLRMLLAYPQASAAAPRTAPARPTVPGSFSLSTPIKHQQKPLKRIGRSPTPPSPIMLGGVGFRSGQCNPPVIGKTTRMQRDGLFKIAHLEPGIVVRKQASIIVLAVPGHSTVSNSEQRYAVGCGRLQRKLQPFWSFPPSSRPSLGAEAGPPSFQTSPV
jgi:hypothetical protein